MKMPLGECLHPDWCGGSDLCRNCRVPYTKDTANNCCDRGCCSLKPWTARFAVLLECRNCLVQFEVEHPDPSKEFAPYAGLPGGHRLVLIGCPELCPQCRNEGVTQRPKNVVDFKRRRPAG